VKFALLELVPGITTANAHRTSRAAIERYRADPHVDPVEWAVADVKRRMQEQAKRIRYRDPTGEQAARNADAQRGGRRG